MLSCALLSFGLIASEMTGSGTYIDVIATLTTAVGEGVARVAVDAEQRARCRRRRRSSMSSIVVGVHAHEAADLVALCRCGC